MTSCPLGRGHVPDNITDMRITKLMATLEAYVASYRRNPLIAPPASGLSARLYSLTPLWVRARRHHVLD